jgi:ferric-dicitrate binding protein FerR (iron transport regulator)
LSVEPGTVEETRPSPPAAAPERRRRGRNIALLVVLLGVAVLFYVIALVKLAKPHLGAP